MRTFQYEHEKEKGCQTTICKKVAFNKVFFLFICFVAVCVDSFRSCDSAFSSCVVLLCYFAYEKNEESLRLCRSENHYLLIVIIKKILQERTEASNKLM